MSRFVHTSSAARQCHPSDSYDWRFFNQMSGIRTNVLDSHSYDVGKDLASGDDDDKVLPGLGLKRIDL